VDVWPQLTWARWMAVCTHVSKPPMQGRGSRASYELTVNHGLEETEEHWWTWARTDTATILGGIRPSEPTGVRLGPTSVTKPGASDFLSVLDAERTLLGGRKTVSRPARRQTATSLVAFTKRSEAGGKNRGPPIIDRTENKEAVKMRMRLRSRIPWTECDRVM